MDELTTALGGVSLEVTREDGSKETVFVRRLRAKDMPNFLLAIEDEEKQIQLACGQSAEWIEGLSAESYNVVADQVQELNLAFFEGWFRRQMKRLEVLKPGLSAGLDQMVAKVMQEAAKGSASPGSSSPSPAVTG